MRLQPLFAVAVAACCAALTGAAAIREANAKELAKSATRTAGPLFPEPEYFGQKSERTHYDARFADGPLKESEKPDAIRILIQTYLATFRDLGVQTWLMHGSLLGWWWGKKVMPWDLDVDVQVTEADMYYLAAYHNMTIYYYKYGGMKTGRFFLLEIDPNFQLREQDDTKNVDARWIDMNTGLFIDITAARYDPDHPEGEGMLYDKNGHEYRDTYLFPLQKTKFEGVSALIPYRYREMLVSEYGEAALKNRRFNFHEFDEEQQQWIPAEEL